MARMQTGGFAPGTYECRCVYCRGTFEGDKRALACENCAAIVRAGYQPPVNFDSPEEADEFERATARAGEER